MPSVPFISRPILSKGRGDWEAAYPLKIGGGSNPISQIERLGGFQERYTEPELACQTRLRHRWRFGERRDTGTGAPCLEGTVWRLLGL